MRTLVSPLVLLGLAALALASSDTPPVGPAPFPALAPGATPVAQQARADAIAEWSSGARPLPSLELRCTPVQDPAPTCLRAAAPLGGTVSYTDPSGLVHHIDYSTDQAAWAAMLHLSQAASVERIQVRFGG